MPPEIYFFPPSMMSTVKRARSDDEPAPVVWGSQKKVKNSLLGDDDGGPCYDEPHDHFVLCGRGERTNRHPGNKAFRRVVEANRVQYHSGPTSHKSLIARSIVEAVMRQNPPGRFVKKDNTSGLWIDIGIKEAIKKTSQALREEIPKEKKAVEEIKEDNEKESSGSEVDEPEDEKPPSSTPRNLDIYAHEQGFVKGTVSFNSSEQGENGATEEDDDFDRMIDNLEFLGEHEADHEDLRLSSQPMSDFWQSSSEGPSDVLAPISLLYQSSIGSSAISVVSRNSDSPTGADVGVSKSIFDDGYSGDVAHHITNIERV